MCGITGMVGRGPIDREALARMTRVLEHRGPDDEGFHVREYDDGAAVGLGFRRLSIIDLTTGNQPIGNEDGSIQLVFNGEVYNYRELRRELEARGHRFATNADTETIVHLYEDEGARCVERLNGMFALALWDEPRRELLLARDRFGKKPLYYAEVGDSLIFGSELKALLQHPLCPHELDFDALTRYLALEYVPAPHAILDGVRKLPGGHVLRWRDGRAVVERYWDLEFDPARGDGRTEDDYAGELRTHLRAAVGRRLLSDVPLGAFLSGGIDSSSVVAMMADQLPADAVKTFSIRFEEPSFDESEHSRRVAAHFGTTHHEHVFAANELLELLPVAVDFLDEPFGDPSILPTHLLSRFTREHVTVALGGDGADELLAGYPTFAAERAARLYRVPRFVHGGLVRAVDRLPVSSANFSLDFKLSRFFRGARSPAATRHAEWLGSFGVEQQAALLTRSPGDPLREQRELMQRAPTGDALNRLIYQYAKSYLQDDILTKVDRASMASSLEVRAPFLDVELVDFLGRVPPGLKLKGLRTKHLLKRAMGDTLPPGIATRAKKGFGIPIAAWFRKELREQLTDTLAPGRIARQGIFRPEEVQRYVSEHLSGRRNHHKALWTLFVFQLWHERWLENAPARELAPAAGGAL